MFLYLKILKTFFAPVYKYLLQIKSPHLSIWLRNDSAKFFWVQFPSYSSYGLNSREDLCVSQSERKKTISVISYSEKCGCCYTNLHPPYKQVFFVRSSKMSFSTKIKSSPLKSKQIAGIHLTHTNVYIIGANWNGSYWSYIVCFKITRVWIVGEKKRRGGMLVIRIIYHILSYLKNLWLHVNVCRKSLICMHLKALICMHLTILNHLKKWNYSI